MAKHLLISIALGGLLLSGCSRGRDRLIKNAPTSASQTGFLTQGAAESALQSLSTKYPNLTYRKIYPSQGLYEIYGLNKDELVRELGPGVTVTPNRFMNERIRPPDDRDFIEDCRSFASPDQPNYQVQINSELDSFEISYIFELGTNIDVQLQSETDLEFLWKLTPPEGSKQKKISGSQNSLAITPDTTGEYALVVVGKDSHKKCQVQKFSLFITSNPKWNPSTALSPEDKQAFDLTGFWHLEDLDIPSAWKKSEGQGVVIAVIDSGVNYNHPSISENIYYNSNEIPGNGLDDDANGFVDDYTGYDFTASDPFPFDDQGHGTHVAGLAAAATFGVARKAKIMPIKTMAGLGFDIGSYAAAIYYAVDNGAHIINASFGWPEEHEIFKGAIDYAQKHGVLIVAAAGNGKGLGIGQNLDQEAFYPASYKHDNILTVTALNEVYGLARYANYGPLSVDVATLGGTSELPLYSAAKYNSSGSLYKALYGTSQAAPIIAGAAALEMANNPKLSTDQLIQRLIRKSQPQPQLEGLIQSGGLFSFSDNVASPMSR